MVPDEEWLCSQVPPSSSQMDDGSRFLLSDTHNNQPQNSNGSVPKEPLTIILTKPPKKTRGRTELHDTHETTNDSTSFSKSGAQESKRKRKQSRTTSSSSLDAHQQEQRLGVMPISSSLLSPFLAPSVNANSVGSLSPISSSGNVILANSNPRYTNSNFLMSAAKAPAVSSGPPTETRLSLQPPTDIWHFPLSIQTLHDVVGILSRQITDLQQQRMLVFLEDYNNYRCFSRFVSWRKSTHPLLNEVIALVMQQQHQWLNTDSTNTIVCCGWTNRQTIHVLQFDDIQQTHPQLIRNLVMFTHYVNGLYKEKV